MCSPAPCHPVPSISPGPRKKQSWECSSLARGCTGCAAPVLSPLHAARQAAMCSVVRALWFCVAQRGVCKHATCHAEEPAAQRHGGAGRRPVDSADLSSKGRMRAGGSVHTREMQPCAGGLVWFESWTGKCGNGPRSSNWPLPSWIQVPRPAFYSGVNTRGKGGLE